MGKSEKLVPPRVYASAAAARAHMYIYAPPVSYTNVDAEGGTVDVRVTTSLTAASHEDGTLLNGLLRRGNNASNCDSELEDGIVSDRKIRTHTSRRDILKELLELHFSCERSVANIYNLWSIVYDARGGLNGS